MMVKTLYLQTIESNRGFSHHPILHLLIEGFFNPLLTLWMMETGFISLRDFFPIIQFSEMNNDGEMGTDTMIMIAGYTPMDNDTVDGRNPAPPWTVETLSIKG